MYMTQNAEVVYYLKNTLKQQVCFYGTVDACSPTHDAVTCSNLTLATFIFKKN